MSTLTITTKPIYIVSYPKAGRTWLSIMLGSVFLNLPLKKLIKKRKFFRLKPHRSSLIFLHGKYHEPNTWPKFFKTLAKKRVIILVRDPRDIIVSLYFHEKFFAGGKYLKSDLHGFINNQTCGIKNIVEYYNNLLTHIEHPITIVRYEDLKDQTEEELRRIITALGLTADSKQIKAAVVKTKFETMKEKAKTINHISLRLADPTNPESGRIRKGKVGGYKDYLTPEEQTFVTEATKELDSRYGYNNLKK